MLLRMLRADLARHRAIRCPDVLMCPWPSPRRRGTRNTRRLGQLPVEAVPPGIVHMYAGTPDAKGVAK